MRFELFACLLAIVGLVSLPFACADATMNEWNQLIIDQFLDGLTGSPFVSDMHYDWLGMWRRGEGCEMIG